MKALGYLDLERLAAPSRSDAELLLEAVKWTGADWAQLREECRAIARMPVDSEGQVLDRARRADRALDAWVSGFNVEMRRLFSRLLDISKREGLDE